MTKFAVPKTPWWSRLIGWYRRRQFERKDRAEKIRLQSVPVFKGTIIGKTTWINNPNGGKDYVQDTHRWDCYETPSGVRSVKFIRMSAYSPRRNEDGSDHAIHHTTITPWLERKWDCAWEKIRENAGTPWGWNK